MNFPLRLYRGRSGGFNTLFHQNFTQLCRCEQFQQRYFSQNADVSIVICLIKKAYPKMGKAYIVKNVTVALLLPEQPFLIVKCVTVTRKQNQTPTSAHKRLFKFLWYHHPTYSPKTAHGQRQRGHG